MEKRIPLTFFLIRRAGPSLRSQESFNAFKSATTEPRLPANYTGAASTFPEGMPLVNLPIELIKTPKKFDATDETKGDFTFSDLIAAETRKDPNFGDFRVNIYALVREKNSINMVFKTLHEDPKAQGHFVIIESNCNLSPDIRSEFQQIDGDYEDQEEQQQKRKPKDVSRKRLRNSSLKKD